MAAKDEVRRSKLEDNNLLSPPPPCNYQLYPWFSAVEERFSPPCRELKQALEESSMDLSFALWGGGGRNTGDDDRSCSRMVEILRVRYMDGNGRN